MFETAKRHPSAEPSEKQEGVQSGTAAESRLDPVTGSWTIFSPQRTGRPDEFVEGGSQIAPNIDCPFCPGNEDSTPDAVWIGRISSEDSSLDILESAPVDSDWSVRVVPNKFPAVDGIEVREGAKRSGVELFQRRGIGGGHEVIIESRHHVQSLTDLDLAELNLVFRAYRDRLRYWRSVAGISYLSAFKNVGAKAGASLSHSHSQLIATDRVPSMVSHSINLMTRHRATTGCCLMCDLIRGEIKQHQRIVWRDQSLVALCPFASHLPMLVRVTTLEHEGCFENLDDERLESVSRLVGKVVSWLERLLPNTAYNFCLQTRPPAMKDSHDAFHWWIDIFPRMTQVAGFEWSSQCMINPVPPEDSAAKLRACARSEDPRRL